MDDNASGENAARALGGSGDMRGLKAILNYWPSLPLNMMQGVIFALYKYAYHLTPKQHKAKLQYATQVLWAERPDNLEALLTVAALGLKPKLLANLPAHKKDARHKIDYLMSIKKQMGEHSLFEIFKIFELDKLKVKTK